MVRRAEQSNYSLESIDRMALVLKALEQAPEQTLEQIARLSGLNESTALRYLLSLSKHEMVERNEASGRFRLGLSLFRLGSRSIEYRDIVTLSLPVMERLLAQFGESVNLATRQQGQVMLLRVLESATPTRKGAKAGETDAWHATSLGKALLAAMPGAEATSILKGGPLAAYTPTTLTRYDDLLRDLERAQTRGYAIDDEESVEGLRCVGAAIRDHAGVPRYALSVSGPKSRMPYQRTEEIGTAVMKGAAEVSRALGA
ncbi:MAG: IclR family transcriptional regulator [Devosia nanyangense]|uniref:IclR family transcriptional regulator n=1 Tax=Devosia nanyangense TaxID=1228055 RepID=A0A933L3F3_9HYPH|nr:IclR family transcriptional regulator [Devosia nanyangense]